MGCATCSVRAQVFTVGEKTATADIRTDFTPTRVELPDKPLTQRGRRELLRNLEAEQGFAHRVLPLGAIVTLNANGHLAPGDEAYKQMIYKKGESAGAGDRVVITALEFKGDRILIDFNGGPYVKHRFLRHISIGAGGADLTPRDDGAQATGCRITLVFEGQIPDVSAPEVKALLKPIVDFGVKTGDLAYADTLPTPIKSAIDSHEVLVGMNHRMVLAALGQPEIKMREGANDDRYEEWIYGHQPQTMKFVRFVGDRVTLLKIAEMGKPMEIHDHDEMGGALPPAAALATATVGDIAPAEGQTQAPSLRLPGEAPAADSTLSHKVQYPAEHKAPSPASPVAGESKPAAPAN